MPLENYIEVLINRLRTEPYVPRPNIDRYVLRNALVHRKFGNLMIHIIFAASLPTTTSSISCSTCNLSAFSIIALIRARPAPRPRAFGETKTEPILLYVLV